MSRFFGTLVFSLTQSQMGWGLRQSYSKNCRYRLGVGKLRVALMLQISKDNLVRANNCLRTLKLMISVELILQCRIFMLPKAGLLDSGKDPDYIVLLW